jgi:hypothetical protein
LKEIFPRQPTFESTPPWERFLVWLIADTGGLNEQAAGSRQLADSSSPKTAHFAIPRLVRFMMAQWRATRESRILEVSSMPDSTEKVNGVTTTSRRHFLRAGAAVGGAVLAGGISGSPAVAADNLPPNTPEWMNVPGDPMGSQPYGTPSPFEKDVVKNISKNLKQYLSASGRTPLQDLDGIITPNGLFYERHHAGVPTIDPAQHRLMLHGLVEHPLIFTMEDIRRFRRSRISISSNAQAIPDTRSRMARPLPISSAF